VSSRRGPRPAFQDALPQPPTSLTSIKSIRVSFGPPFFAIFRAHTNMDMDLDPPFQSHRRKQNAGVELSNDIWLVVLDLVSMKSKLVSDAN
jgi:hypothetical protein